MKFRTQPTRSGLCLGAIEIPTSMPGIVCASAVGDDRADALAKAALVAERIASDPVMAALMPPQAMAAIKAAKGLAAAAKMGSGTLRSLWGSLRGPGKQRLAKVLLAEAKSKENVGAWWNPITHTKKTVQVLKKLSPTHHVLKRIQKRRRKREPDEYDDEPIDDEGGTVGDIADAVGFIPMLMLAAKYGPGAAAAGKKAYMARKRKQAEKRKRQAAAAAAADEREAESDEVEAAQAAAADQGADDVAGEPATSEGAWSPGHGRWMPNYFDGADGGGAE
jgi:hypothetical protein